jgi:hypothetical protein
MEALRYRNASEHGTDLMTCEFGAKLGAGRRGSYNDEE